MKYISIVWTIILVGTLTMLTIFGFKYKEVVEYKKLENEIKSITKQYVESNDITIKNKSKSIKLEKIIEFEPKLEESLIDNCTGKVNVKKIFIVNTYKVLLKCDNYKS